ncbi:alpha/beta fold hydrolase [Variovorax saccharolyticus]|uniref:alpha/beta fold hydrolase n=1 Tax=Variovorax saccharolyticus TaxID=3053516 RepID=UPI0025789205|nr:alpha/beta fold hydrolase [Variovorax sp. J22R187]MDM0022254.1 alpha/beta fold hydrolase [Variovorax sp. J22R187]
MDLLLNCFSNLLIVRRIHRYLQDQKPPTLVIWGKHDPVFRTVGAEAFRRDNAAAEVHFLDTGHFALETHLTEVAGRVKAFLRERLLG